MSEEKEKKEEQKEPIIITQKELERVFKDNEVNSSDSRFIFLLGAGSSVQSGIPTAGTLADEWIKHIEDDLGDSYQEWIEKENIDLENLAASYTSIYNKRFEHSAKNGYETLQKKMENIQPSIGYTILSQILENKNHNFVITTNFDSLIEDALFLFTSKRPLVCGHESLADFIQLNSTRPTIIKVHRDILLNPYSKPEETCSINKSLGKALEPIIENSPMIVIGYGGNDESVMKLLRESKREAVYWCTRDITEIHNEIKKALTNESDRIVLIDGFDELMVALQSNVYSFESIKSLSNDDENESLIVKKAYEKVKTYKDELKKFEEEVKKSNSNDFKENSKSILPSWWDYIIKASNEKDLNKQKNIYLEGINAYKDNDDLLSAYGEFLYLNRDFKNALIYFKKALDLEPELVVHNVNYALLLYLYKKDYKNAKKYMEKSIKIDPNYNNANASYAIYLDHYEQDFKNAEYYYKKSLELSPDVADNNGNYAGFLLKNNKKEEATKYLNKAFLNEHEQYDLQLELWFYRLAHYPETYDEAKENLNKLLEEGHTSDNWDFSKNIKRAIEDGNKNIKELKNYAKRISGIDYSDIN